MPLTVHQNFHLKAVIRETDQSKQLSLDLKSKLATAKDVVPADYDSYLDAVKAKADAILKSDNFPVGLAEPSDIHDFLEKKLDG